MSKTHTEPGERKMRLGKNQITEIAEMIRALFISLNYHAKGKGSDSGYPHMVQIKPDTFSPDDQDCSLHNSRRNFYANMAKRGLITGSDDPFVYEAVGKAPVSYHTYYYLSPAQLEQYLSNPQVLEAIDNLEGIHSLYGGNLMNPAIFSLVRAYVDGTGELPWCQGHDYWLSTERTTARLEKKAEERRLQEAS